MAAHGMNHDEKLIALGNWGEDIAWKLYKTSVPPPAELCTAVMCVAIFDGKVVLARSERGWGMLGGHIEDGETLETALRREALEEGGFIIARHKLFAVRKITAKVQASQRPGISYPFPVSYMAYYWATASQPLQALTGEEILECGSFALDEVGALKTPDQSVIDAGWEAYRAHQEPSIISL
ncbi:MAG TPA: NUDIX hydrolase [Candidatus Saccharimonadales bacterium]|nr:NUDIX hydrolase [Candidatus Saccharimonadales bacterium]